MILTNDQCELMELAEMVTSFFDDINPAGEGGDGAWYRFFYYLS